MWLGWCVRYMGRRDLPRQALVLIVILGSEHHPFEGQQHHHRGQAALASGAVQAVDSDVTGTAVGGGSAGEGLLVEAVEEHQYGPQSRDRTAVGTVAILKNAKHNYLLSQYGC